MPLKIVHYGDPILQKKGRPVTRFDDELAQFARDMMAAMHDAEGIGLAAPQVGRDLNFFVIDLRGSESVFSYKFDGGSPPLAFIMPMALANPVVEVEPEPTTVYEEGCLSFPGINGDVVRPDRVRVTFQDVAGVSHEMICDGLLGRCVQHEVDHLHGVLFIDRMTKPVFAEIEEAVRKLKKQTLRKVTIS